MVKHILTRWGFLILLFMVLTIGYFFTKKTTSHNHLKKIPADSQSVMIIDFDLFANVYFHLLKKNPAELINITDGKSISSMESPGFNPLTKLAVYTENYKHKTLLGIILPIEDPDLFFKTFNLLEEKPHIQKNSSSSLYYYPNNNAAAFENNGIGYFIKMINDDILTFDYAQKYQDHLQINKGLHLNDNNFNSIIENNDQISIWIKSDSIKTPFLNQFLKKTNTKINFKKGHVSFDIEALLKNKVTLENKSNKQMVLQDQGFAKFSAIVNPSLLYPYISRYFPKNLSFLLNDWDGGINASIIEFNKYPVYNMESTPMFKDVSFPDIALGFKIINNMKIEQYLKSDSLFKPIENGYSFNVPDLLNNPAYLYLINDQVIISTIVLSKHQLETSFHPFSLKINIENLLNEYPTNNDIFQDIAVDYMKQLNIHQLELTFTKKDENKIYLEGTLTIGDKNKHSIIELMPASRLIINNLMSK